jgi:N-acetylglutamate synthase
VTGGPDTAASLAAAARCYCAAMDPAALAGLEHANMLHAFGSTAEHVPGALVAHDGGVLLVASGLPIRIFNAVMIERDTAAPDAIAAAVSTLRERAAPFVVYLRRRTDDRFVPVVKRLGLEVPAHHTPMPGMAMPLPAGGARVTHGLDIRQVVDATGQEDHILTLAAGFEAPPGLIRPWIGADMWERPGVSMYVGYVDDKAVTTGIGIVSGRTIGIYNVATIPSARKRGFGAAITHRIAADGEAAGCDVAALQASDMGRPVYESLGYRTVVEYDGWIDPVEPQSRP